MAPNNTHAPDLGPVPRTPPTAGVTRPAQPDDLVPAHAGLRTEARFFASCGIGKPHIIAAWHAAIRNSTSIERELIAARHVESETYYRFLAQLLGLGFLDRIDPDQVIRLDGQDALLRRSGPLRIHSGDRVLTVLAPEARDIDQLLAKLTLRPVLRQSLVVAMPQAIRDAVWESGGPARVQATIRALADADDGSSARTVMTGVQGFALGAALGLAACLALAWPMPALNAVHLVCSTLFLGNLLLRVSAIAAPRPAAPPPFPEHQPVGLPVYTVLIALRDEAAMAGQLVASMRRLKWPRSLLDIKYICEAGDAVTIAALRASNPGPECEIVIVPPCEPMTKPKALQYALQGARGSLVAVYDAEDMPHPAQMLEAHAAFEKGGTRLACVQAPLAIANNGRSWITALFALEYAGLFRVLLPFLDRFRLPILLGGTSNHFRRDALIDVGGWDPYNVTEDADLGMRLYRHGYRTRAICRATVESAPDTLPVWIRQRSRWHKGWTQTWLVLMRRPFRLFRQLGVRGTLTFQLLLAGMLVSAVLHPALVLFLGSTGYWLLTTDRSWDWSLNGALFATDGVIVASSYLVFLIMGWRGMVPAEKSTLKMRWLAMTPVYWIAMSWAAWRAVAQLPIRPHLWEKTPHPRTMPAAPSAEAHPRNGQPAIKDSADEENRRRNGSSA